jgi:DNA-binding SARP family transcriptional activator
VSVLGQVTAVRGREALQLSGRLLEALTFLAVHPAGVTESEIRTALWGDRPSSPGALRNLLWQLRRQLGSTEDGQPLVAFADEGGKYRLHGDVTCDFLRLADAGDARKLSDLLSNARGRPFECRRGFEWAHAEGLVAWAEARIVALAEELGEAAIENGDSVAAASLADAALVVVPEDERLYRVLFRACGSSGDRGGVERAADRLLAAVAGDGEADAWAAVEPRTLESYVAAGGRRGPATSARSDR